jgi:NADPH:quinone reductase-like Zn-dependent oxidoreductase
MKAMVIDRFGGPEVLHMAEVPTPEPRAGEVLIRTVYAGVNPADWKCREGMLARYFDYKFPFIVGFDAAGTIEAVGPGVAGFAPGDRVLTSSNQGAGEWGSYAQFVRSGIERVCRIPDGMGFAEAATIPVAGTTAWGSTMDVGAAKAGQAIFINGGAGGVGTFAIQLARQAGARVATTCSPNNAAYVRDLGADLVIDYRKEDVLATLQRFAPEGIDLVVDAVGLGSLPADTARVVRRGGRIVPIETLIQDIQAFDPAVAARQGVEVVSNMVAVARIPQHLASVTAAVASGAVKTPPYEVMPLAEAGAAHERVKAGHVRGKILLQVN